jgi:diaminopimelate decarboxylase
MLSREQLLEVTSKHKTPFYLYDGNSIKNQYELLQKAFAEVPDFQVNYAVKALSTISILKLMYQLGAKVDTVSINEVNLALLAGYKPQDISFTPNGVHYDEIQEAIALGVNLTLDNYQQIKYLAKQSSNKPIAIRINPKVKDGGNKKIKVAGKNSKFGLPLEQIKKIHKLIAKYGLQVEGLHIHVGSDVSNMSSYLASAKVLFETAKQFDNLKFINFGGGFKVRYRESDSFIEINSFGKEISQVFNTFKKDYGKYLKLIIEPGKFLVSKSGYFLTEITVIKKKKVFINSGFNHFIRPMYYGAYHHITNISSNQKSDKKYTIVGYICEQDNFGKKRKISKPHVGDIICFENAGAYSFTMASNYNSRLRPKELLLLNNEVNVIRENESFEDLLTHQIY